MSLFLRCGASGLTDAVKYEDAIDLDEPVTFRTADVQSDGRTSVADPHGIWFQ